MHFSYEDMYLETHKFLELKFSLLLLQKIINSSYTNLH